MRVSAATAEVLADGNIDLELDTRNAQARIPADSLHDLTEELLFHFVPVKDEDERNAVEQRARKELVVLNATEGVDIEVVGRPMRIETNMANQPVTLTLPLGDATLRSEQLKHLGVFIEHSDGTKELVRGEIVSYDETGELGIRFTIEKFSTFTIVHLKGEQQPVVSEGQHYAYVTGLPDGTFGPDKSITRAEMAAILARLFQKEEMQTGISYGDVSESHWANAAIGKVSAMGLMTGYGYGNFKPEQTITRAEMAAILTRVLDDVTNASAGSFTDIRGNWAEAAIEQAKAAGIISGYADGKFRPNQAVTRAEAVTMINRLLNREPLTGAEQQWTDVPEGYWAYGAIQEASTNHAYATTEDGGEQMVPAP